MSGVGSSPALATCETSQVLLADVSGGFPGVLPFRPTYTDWPVSMSEIILKGTLNCIKKKKEKKRRILSGDEHRLRISRMRVPRMSLMFSGRPRRDETSSYPSIHEQTLCSDHEKEILYRRKGHEIRLYVGTRI